MPEASLSRKLKEKIIKLASILMVMVSVLLMTRCEPCRCDPVDEQPLYFEYHYLNWAWGYQERGWLIDREGDVRYFESPDHFRIPDSTGLVTLEDLEYNLGQTDSIITTVDKDELEEYVSYIPGAAEGQIGEKRNIAADAGSSTLACYLYDEKTGGYRYVFLGESGDWEQFNLSDEAEILVDWLRGFGVFWLSE
jgi:hypothetical protein